MFAALWGLSPSGPARVGAAEPDDGITALEAKTSKDYVRSRLPDGTFRAEYYAFGQGGPWGGEIRDATIDPLSFRDIAHVISAPLAEQKYLPGFNPAQTSLLIMVYWGTTAVPMRPQEDPLYLNYEQTMSEYNILLSEARNSPAANVLIDEANSILSSGLHQLEMANHRRDQLDLKNAAMLGYGEDGLVATERGTYLRHTALGITARDELAEIEEHRYFVVLMAYDFQLMWKQKKHKLLWETRFSIREQNHQFDRDLPAMARFAAQYFGQDTRGLVRKAVPLGKVEIGEVRSLGEVEGAKK